MVVLATFELMFMNGLFDHLIINKVIQVISSLLLLRIHAFGLNVFKWLNFLRKANSVCTKIILLWPLCEIALKANEVQSPVNKKVVW